MFMETRLRGGRGRNNKGVNREKKWGDAVGTKRRGEVGTKKQAPKTG